jgi:hypothetical protein
MARSATVLPVQKITAVGIAGAISTMIVWGLDEFANRRMPPETQGALMTIITFLAGYVTPPGEGEVVENEPSKSTDTEKILK